jgi:two-component system NarL family sensor kinase
MFILQTNIGSIGISGLMFFGTLGMVLLVMTVVTIVIFNQRKIIKFSTKVKKLEQEKQQILLNASIQFQEEERNRIAADLHDDAGPLLATARLYLSDHIVNQNREEQLETVASTRKIIDDAIMLIRNISHNLMPPTLKNFGLESAAIDLFQKIKGSGAFKATVKFKNYQQRLDVDKELLIFRIIQELINNIFKHSKSNFIHLTQNVLNDKMYFRLQHNGTGLSQEKFEELSHLGNGLGLKNISSRVKVLSGSIFFELDQAHSYYKVTLEIPNPIVDKIKS